ncbi:MAG: hypothetical protein LBR07_08225 [Puniceicoccales bacterium]|nr:hypothetical protein [Puniceicoccales bacterium]
MFPPAPKTIVPAPVGEISPAYPTGTVPTANPSCPSENGSVVAFAAGKKCPAISKPLAHENSIISSTIAATLRNANKTPPLRPCPRPDQTSTATCATNPHLAAGAVLAAADWASGLAAVSLTVCKKNSSRQVRKNFFHPVRHLADAHEVRGRSPRPTLSHSERTM